MRPLATVRRSLAAPSPHAGDHKTADALAGRESLPEHVLNASRKSRRYPRPTQFDYLHLRYLLVHLRQAIRNVPRPAHDVLDVFCGTRPYDDLFPGGSRVVGLDVNVRYGVPDVVSTEFLPFEAESFDLVMCIEGFQYITDASAAAAELWRVLRPGGTLIITVPYVWEYDVGVHERRYTGPDLAVVFSGWDDRMVVANGCTAVAWTTLTGYMLDIGEQYLARRFGGWRAWRTAFAPAYVTLNALGVQLDRAERRLSHRRQIVPMNLLLSARRPVT